MENKGQLINELQAASGLPEREKVEQVAAAVLRLLYQRLGPEADDFVAQLPNDVKPMLTGGVGGRVRDALVPQDKFHFEDMVERVAQDGGIDRAKAREMTVMVFHELKEHVSEGETRHVASVLPQDLQQVWERA